MYGFSVKPAGGNYPEAVVLARLGAWMRSSKEAHAGEVFLGRPSELYRLGLWLCEQAQTRINPPTYELPEGTYIPS